MQKYLGGEKKEMKEEELKQLLNFFSSNLIFCRHELYQLSCTHGIPECRVLLLDVE